VTLLEPCIARDLTSARRTREARRGGVGW
jgi:hypothetical protein